MASEDRETTRNHARADAALQRISDGADPTEEAFGLANEINDAAMNRVHGWFTRRRRRE